MIRYALLCADCEAEFEAWFGSSAAYTQQATSGEVECPSCGGHRIAKQIMAPAVRSCKTNVPASGPGQMPTPAEFFEAARKYIADTHDYVGNQFPDEARAMHYGEIDDRPIWGDVSPDDAKALEEEGISAFPLPGPLAPPKPKDKAKLN